EWYFSSATCARQLDYRIDSSEHGQCVTCRRAVCDVPTDRSTMLNLTPADLTRGRNQHGQRSRDERRPNQLGIGRQRTDSQTATATVNPAKLPQSPQVHEPRLLQRAEIERDIDVGTPGNGHHRFLVSTDRERVAEGLRIEELALTNEGRHQRCF